MIRKILLVASLFLVSGCAEKPLTNTDQSPTSNRELVFNACKEYTLDELKWILEYNNPPENLEVLRLIRRDFLKASRAEPMNKEYEKVYKALDKNADIFATYRFAQMNNMDFIFEFAIDNKIYMKNAEVITMFCYKHIESFIDSK